ncbi:Homeobox protein DBX1 [Eumeta japonica]|uniref:Homeobox protein DBX1 n=1 Tax=Eumeta variegata TaxID=151549 RepID=A0A4C1ZYH4_EUMVA|nr:Homeobox protein DBX1 [Eumeta japonica]
MNDRILYHLRAIDETLIIFGSVRPTQAHTQVFPLPGAFPWAHSSRGKPRRGMMRRAVFSDLQRKGLEKRFQVQKYISKPDRKKLAEKLGLKDSQASGHALRRLGLRHTTAAGSITDAGSFCSTLRGPLRGLPFLSAPCRDPLDVAGGRFRLEEC